MALRGGVEGLDTIAPIIDGLDGILADDGLFVLEFGDDQAVPVGDLAERAGIGPARIGLDMHGDERILIVDRWVRPDS